MKGRVSSGRRNDGETQRRGKVRAKVGRMYKSISKTCENNLIMYALLHTNTKSVRTDVRESGGWGWVGS